jgi:hypothetical protein
VRGLILAIALALTGTAALAQKATPEAAPADEALAACAPPTLSEAVVCLDTHLPASHRDQLLATPHADLIKHHFGLGLWIRNNWGLWGGGPLADDMRRLDISHPDSMSQAVIEAYWLAKQGCPGPVPKGLVEPLSDAAGKRLLCPILPKEFAS